MSSERNDRPDGRSNTTLRILWACRVVVGVLVLVGLGWAIWKAVADVASQEIDWRDFDIRFLVLAVFLYGIALSFPALMWRQTLASMGIELTMPHALRVFFASQLGKYVPGKAMVIVVRCGMVCSRRDGKSPSRPVGPVVASTFVETLMWVLVGAQFGCVGLLFQSGLSPTLRWGALCVMCLFGAATVPPVFSWTTSLAARLVGKPSSDRSAFRLRWSTYFQAWLLSAAGWLVNGWSMWMMFRTISPEAGFGDYGLALTTIALATVGGFISMLPGGVGVRELVMVPLLATRFSAATGLAVAVLMRCATLIVEIGLASLTHWAQPGEKPGDDR